MSTKYLQKSTKCLQKNLQKSTKSTKYLQMSTKIYENIYKMSTKIYKITTKYLQISTKPLRPTTKKSITDTKLTSQFQLKIWSNTNFVVRMAFFFLLSYSFMFFDSSFYHCVYACMSCVHLFTLVNWSCGAYR